MLGFTPRAAVAGADQCVPRVIYAVDAAILMNYYDSQYQDDNAIYKQDLYINTFRLVAELYGAFAYCEFNIFGPRTLSSKKLGLRVNSSASVKSINK